MTTATNSDRIPFAVVVYPHDRAPYVAATKAGKPRTWFTWAAAERNAHKLSADPQVKNVRIMSIDDATRCFS